MPFFLIYIASWLSISSGIYVLFDRAEVNIKKKKKKQIGNWLLNRRLPDAPNWPEMFANTFDAVFGEKHWSWKCFWRSIIFSTFGIIFFSALYVVPEFLTSIESPEILSEFIRFLLAILPVLVFGNYFGDYLSLLETRWILSITKKRNTTIHYIIFTLSDLILTYLIFFVFLYLIYNIIIVGIFDYLNLNTSFFSFEDEIDSILEQFISVLTGASNTGKIFLYTTFLTSIWLWLYILSSFIIRIYTGFRNTTTAFFGLIDIKNAPLRSMGFVLMILISLVYLLAIPFVDFGAAGK